MNKPRKLDDSIYRLVIDAKVDKNIKLEKIKRMYKNFLNDDTVKLKVTFV